MGLDMYLSANITRDDLDERAQQVFKVIDDLYPNGVPHSRFSDAEHGASLCTFEEMEKPDPRVEKVRQVIATHFPAVYRDNNWIGGYFNTSRIQLPLMYWRKENHIHRWFVEETQDGIDECQPSEVTREKLFEFRKILKRVEADHSLAPELLPTQAGFFFGDTSYSEYYFEGVTATRRRLDVLCEIGLTERTVIQYQASW